VTVAISAAFAFFSARSKQKSVANLADNDDRPYCAMGNRAPHEAFLNLSAVLKTEPLSQPGAITRFSSSRAAISTTLLAHAL